RRRGSRRSTPTRRARSRSTRRGWRWSSGRRPSSTSACPASEPPPTHSRRRRGFTLAGVCFFPFVECGDPSPLLLVSLPRRPVRSENQEKRRRIAALEKSHKARLLPRRRNHLTAQSARRRRLPLDGRCSRSYFLAIPSSVHRCLHPTGC